MALRLYQLTNNSLLPFLLSLRVLRLYSPSEPSLIDSFQKGKFWFFDKASQYIKIIFGHIIKIIDLNQLVFRIKSTLEQINRDEFKL